jgi:hypothetical protein
VLGRVGDGRRECSGGIHVITSTPEVLNGACAEQRVARGRVALLASVGLLASAGQALAAGRSRVPVGMVLPDAFRGILSPARLGGGIPAAVVIVSSALLLWCWWYLLGEARSGRLPMRRATWIVVAWAVPILPGPPLLSFDAYAYLAQGQMLARGLDPYSVGPVTLGSDPILSMVDPLWRSSPAPYGPVTLLMLRLVAMAHVGPTTAVLMLRLLALLGVAAAVIGALLLSRPEQRPMVLVLTAANPMTLLHLLGGVHIDAVLSGLVVAALLALHADRARSALVIAGVALACKVTVLPLFLLVAVILVRRQGGRVVWLALGALIAPVAVSGLILDRPWGFIHALVASEAAPSWYAPASIVGLVVKGAAADVGAPVGWRQAHLAGSGVVLVVGAVVVANVCRWAWLDAGPDVARRDIVRAGVVLLVPVLALPSLFGWYLGPGVFVVAAAPAARGHRVLVTLCSLLSFSSLPAMYGAVPWPLVLAWAVALGICLSGFRRHRRTREAAGPPAIPEPAAASTATPPADALTGDRGSASGPAPRMLPIAVAAAESLVVLVLVGLVSMPGAQATDKPDAATRAKLATRSRAVISVGELVHNVYPDRELARVLAQPVQPTTDGLDLDFDVELVQPGRGACWIQVGVPAWGLATRLAEPQGVASEDQPVCPEPLPAANQPPLDSARLGPR